MGLKRSIIKDIDEQFNALNEMCILVRRVYVIGKNKNMPQVTQQACIIAKQLRIISEKSYSIGSKILNSDLS